MTTNVWVIEEPNAVPQAIDETSTTQLNPLGKIVRARHTTFGQGEFIYLLGVASTAVGSLATYTGTTWLTTLAPSTANLTDPCAVSMSANVASQYGWYQISGIATIKKTAVAIAAGAKLFINPAGSVNGTASAGKQLQNAKVAASAASASGTITVVIDRPSYQGQIT